jgi:tRNA dimethylallyltransferase
MQYILYFPGCYIFSAADYQRGAYRLIPEIAGRGRLPIIVGGTGLYVDAVTQGYDLTGGEPDPARRAELEALPEAALRELIQKRNIPYRADSPNYALTKHRCIRIIERCEAGEPPEGRPNSPRFETLTLGLNWDKELLHRRIEERLKARLKAGLLEEAKAWLSGGGDAAVLEALGLEFRHSCRYARGAYKNEAELTEELGRAIRQFAKRQLTWFRRNRDIIWLDMSGDYQAEAGAQVLRYLSSSPS